jgi:hypothetical protein
VHELIATVESGVTALLLMTAQRMLQSVVASVVVWQLMQQCTGIRKCVMLNAICIHACTVAGYH